MTGTLKLNKTVPLYKSGDKQDHSNYRPNSIHPNFDKIMSKIVNNQLMDYLIKNNLIG